MLSPFVAAVRTLLLVAAVPPAGVLRVPTERRDETFDGLGADPCQYRWYVRDSPKEATRSSSDPVGARSRIGGWLHDER